MMRWSLIQWRIAAGYEEENRIAMLSLGRSESSDIMAILWVSGDDSNEWDAIFVPLFRFFAIVRLWSGTTSNYKLSLTRNRQELSYHYTSILASIWNVITGMSLSAKRYPHIWKSAWSRDRSYNAISYKSSDIYRNNLFKVRLELIREMIAIGINFSDHRESEPDL